MSDILIIDGNNLTLRAAHATPPLYDASGVPTACLMTSLRTLCKISSIIKPLRVFWVWDGGHSKFRKSLFPEYKNRVKFERKNLDEDDTEDSFISSWKEQVSLLERYLPFLGAAQVRIVGCEADDIIYRLKNIFTVENFDIVLATSDLDFNQIVDEKFKVFNLSKNKLVDAFSIEEEFGVRPEQWCEYRSMVGDTSDNIPGVESIGEKRSSEIMKKYGTFEKFYSSFPSIEKPKSFEINLYKSSEIFYRNLSLIDFSKLPENEVPQFEVRRLVFCGLGIKPDLKSFRNVCLRHQLSTLMSESAMWKAVCGDS